MAHFFEEQSEIKLIILFVIQNFKRAITNQELTDIAMRDNILNYFDMRQYLTELISSELVKNSGDVNHPRYRLTARGEETLSCFRDTIPFSVRENLLLGIKQYLKKEKDAGQILTKYNKLNELEYEVILSMLECGYPLFELSMIVPTEERARKMCMDFKMHPDQVYQSILSAFPHAFDMKPNETSASESGR